MFRDSPPEEIDVSKMTPEQRAQIVEAELGDLIVRMFNIADDHGRDDGTTQGLKNEEILGK